ncbi:uncharacterized protein BKCO1_3600022 [Diplodia corticola]|uniref:Uncharacterized protein n=1 Tax=Diplodia corticola TaxID=236234 RepID=A0A1J9QXQ5_9PEZI|nr:uncharacterized protein BKCO1_3600022 [Diplodia corticola]OJD32770.1 hypothetical protein BKCO1_3600022 [Diplodia corticola]
METEKQVVKPGSAATIEYTDQEKGVTKGTGSEGTSRQLSTSASNAADTIFAMGPLLGPVVGPVGGGFLVEAKRWRWWAVFIVLSRGLLGPLHKQMGSPAIWTRGRLIAQYNLEIT